jgi:hypothetical protein
LHLKPGPADHHQPSAIQPFSHQPYLSAYLAIKGHQKKTRRIFDQLSRPNIFFLIFFSVMVMGVQKHHEHEHVFVKSPCRKVFPKNRHKRKINFDVSFSSTFSVLSHFRVFLSDGSSKTPQKTFYKNKSKTDFSRFFFKSRFWAFLGEGS